MNNKFSDFIYDIYGSIGTFEHGRIGQTVFHSHTHLMPFTGDEGDIVPEGEKYIKKLDNLESLKDIFQKDQQYLFFTIGSKKWTVDTQIGAPRFFRDRFASAMGVPKRGNWKSMHDDSVIMEEAKQEIQSLKNKWNRLR